MSLLELKNLSVSFDTQEGTVRAVNNLSMTMERGETLAVVGESGSGKSQTVFAVMGLLAQNGHASGSILFDNQEILNLDERELNKIRAEQIAMIFQDPMTSLNPYMKVKDQLIEILTLHKGRPAPNLFACLMRSKFQMQKVFLNAIRTNALAVCGSGS
jgi:oligopeptide transport system ATP-binding protein